MDLSVILFRNADCNVREQFDVVGSRGAHIFSISQSVYLELPISNIALKCQMLRLF
jgi:hypothetical protein